MTFGKSQDSLWKPCCHVLWPQAHTDRGSHHCPLQWEGRSRGTFTLCPALAPRHQSSAFVQPFLHTGAFECHSRCSGRALGPREETGVQACPVPRPYLQGPATAGSLLSCLYSLGYQVAYTCLVFFSSLKGPTAAHLPLSNWSWTRLLLRNYGRCRSHEPSNRSSWEAFPSAQFKGRKRLREVHGQFLILRSECLWTKGTPH